MTTNQPTILIADDDAAWRQVLEARLTHCNFKIISAANGHDAMRAFDENDIQVALLDVQLPGIDGFGVCEHIRSQPKGEDVPVIFLTGCENSIVRQHFSTLTSAVRGDSCLTKPFDSEQLIKMIRQALEPELCAAPA